MFEFNSKSKAGILKAATVIMSLMSIQAQGAGAADTVELKSLSPQVDTAPPPEAVTQPAAKDMPKLHKLEASKRALRDDSADEQETDQQATLQLEEVPQTMKHIVIMNNHTLRANLPRTAIADPFTMMQAMFGSRSKQYEKLFAEQDTGYGVCGFLMNMPTMKPGYALIIKCFDSMPAAQADLRPGDFITAVNGQSTLGLPPKEVWDWFTGMPGTEVKIDVLRDKQPISVTLKRMDIGRIPDFPTRAEFLTIFHHNGMSKFVQK